jgi:hypothetical protein
MMVVEKDGEKLIVPTCTCGKCIVRRIRKGFFDSIPYNKNLGSTYTKDYDWKTNNLNPDFYNRSKHSGFEGCYRTHLPTGLMSTMKFDYKPFKVDLEDPKRQDIKLESVPFFGRTTYSVAYPNWGSSLSDKNTKTTLPEIKIPLRGNSNYKENYIKHPDEFYAKRPAANFAKATLEFFGKLNPDTTYKTSFLPVDFNQPHYFTKDKVRKENVEKSSLIPADFPKSNFESIYHTSFVDFQDRKCRLAEYLKKRGISYLEI